MKVSVITPFYEGDKYMDAYVDCMLKNAEALRGAGHELEVILVNDSPWKTLATPGGDNSANPIRVITNEKNSGIHFSRVQGLLAATGDYVMFLDQDDLLAEDALLLLLKEAYKNDAEVTVANALLEQSDGQCLTWYRNDYHKSLVGDIETYLTVGIQIISPGQCLIKKSAVPAFWCVNILGKNGADDYFLWLLLLAEGARFGYLDKALYTHKYTGDNISADTTVTDDSCYEFMEILSGYDDFPEEYVFDLHEMITYKNQFRASSTFGKITCSLAYLPIFIKNLMFKRKTGTAYGFNRG